MYIFLYIKFIILIHKYTVQSYNSLNSKIYFGISKKIDADDHIETKSQTKNIFLEDEAATSI